MNMGWMSFAIVQHGQPGHGLYDGKSPPGSLLEIAEVIPATISNAANQNAEINTDIKKRGKARNV